MVALNLAVCLEGDLNLLPSMDRKIIKMTNANAKGNLLQCRERGIEAVNYDASQVLLRDIDSHQSYLCVSFVLDVQLDLEGLALIHHQRCVDPDLS